MATAGSADLTTTPTTLYDGSSTGSHATTFTVTNDAGSSGNALINVPGLHAAGDFFPLAPGESQPFRSGSSSISTVTAKAVSTATVRYGIVARL